MLLKVNASKCSFCATETEYLGDVLTQEGIKLQPKKVEAILALTPPQNLKQLHRFLGMVKYYRDLWERQSKMLLSLTNLVGECGHTKATRATKTKHTPWHWNDMHQTAFGIIKTALVKDVVLAYPDYLRGFEIYTDSCKFQPGAVITQNNRPMLGCKLLFLLLSPKPPKYYCHSNHSNSPIITVYSPVICQLESHQLP